MISAARLILDRVARGVAPTREELAALPSVQWEVYAADLVPHCPARRTLPVERRPGNALNVEIGEPLPRCMEQSPDGRGSAWMLSGGSLLAYGACDASSCPLRRPPQSP